MAVVQERVGWPRLWGRVLDYGLQHTKGLQVLSRLMSSHGGGEAALSSLRSHMSGLPSAGSLPEGP